MLELGVNSKMSCFTAWDIPPLQEHTAWWDILKSHHGQVPAINQLQTHHMLLRVLPQGG